MTGSDSTSEVPADLPAEFNALAPDAAEAALLACLGVRRWARQVAAGRPYGSVQTLLADAAAAVELSDDELSEALSGHPRIGERASSPEHQSELSEREQAGVDRSDTRAVADLRAANASYEERFDRVFIIRAAGRSAPEILTELRRRLGDDDATERAETVAQLREITVLRLKEML